MLLFIPSGAFAQGQTQVDPGSAKLRIVKDDCAAGASAEDIVVCGSREKTSPYRLPKMNDRFDPNGPVDSVGRERVRLMQGDESGIGSCSNRGPGGLTGCWLQDVKNKRLQNGK